MRKDLIPMAFIMYSLQKKKVDRYAIIGFRSSELAIRKRDPRVTFVSYVEQSQKWMIQKWDDKGALEVNMIIEALKQHRSSQEIQMEEVDEHDPMLDFTTSESDENTN